MDFPDRWAAIAWMCKNQLGRRNLTDEQRTYTIGKMYEAQKTSEKFHGNQHTSGSSQNGNHQKQRASERIASDVGVGKNTVIRAERFSKSLDEAEKAAPGIRDAVLSGEVKAPKSVIAEIRNAPEEKKPEIAKERS